jgi:hypothetical protein
MWHAGESDVAGEKHLDFQRFGRGAEETKREEGIVI